MISDTNRGNIYCRFGCGTRITFDDRFVSTNGKKIPLDYSDHKPHECPKRNYYKKPDVQRSDLQYNNQENQDKDKDNFGPTGSRISFLNRMSEMIEYDNKQQEQILINQNQIKNQQKELMQLLLELAKKWL